ncbi:serine/threonine-protein kinase [Streptacidiphilus sp. PAMC 29251]
MTALQLADPRDAAEISAFLARLLRYDKAAAVRLRTANGALAVFARLPLGESGPLVIRTAALASPGPATSASTPEGREDVGQLDLTVSAGQLLDGIDEAAAETLPLPAAITGPAWAGLLPPRTSWEHVDDLATAPLTAAVQAAVTEFRRESTDPDGLAEAIWSRQVHASGLTLRALHAAHLVGLLRQSETVALHRHPAWLRLTAPRGSVIIRRAPAIGSGLGLTPTR